jgi:hypothetical protein
MTETDGEDLSSILARCSGSLLGVHRVRACDPITGEDILSCEDVEALRFQFPGVELWVACNAATDEIRLSFAGPLWRGPIVVDVSDMLPWRKAIGLELGFAWFMQNDRGYRDGVQFEFFRALEAGDILRIELEAAASKLRVFVVEPA